MATDHQGHRARLWARFLQGGLRGAFHHDYEKLEFLLTFVMPRRNTKDLAKELLRRFGSLTGIVTAAPDLLAQTAGIGEKTAHFLNMLHEFGLVLDEEQLQKRDLLASIPMVKAYLQRELAWEDAEYLVVLYLDSRRRLIHKERLFRGTLDRVPNYPRELARAALAHNAAGVILAHNHPSGDPTPGTRDLAATDEAAAALQTVGSCLLDHFVIGRQSVVSLVEAGLFAPQLG